MEAMESYRRAATRFRRRAGQAHRHGHTAEARRAERMVSYYEARMAEEEQAAEAPAPPSQSARYTPRWRRSNSAPRRSPWAGGR